MHEGTTGWLLASYGYLHEECFELKRNLNFSAILLTVYNQYPNVMECKEILHSFLVGLFLF